LNRKFKCYNVDENNNPCDENNNPCDENNNPDDENNNPCDENNNPDDENNNPCDENNNLITTLECLYNNLITSVNHEDDYNIQKVQCTKCNKIVTRKCFNSHLNVCRGVPKNTCKFCFRSFNKQQGCFKHQKICKSNPDNSDTTSNNDTNIIEISNEEEIHNQVINSNNQVMNNSNNNNNTVHNNIINFNSFGDEGIEQLGEYLSGRKDDSKIIERMRQLGKKKIYGIREIQNDIFFNPDNPEGFSIIKPEKYGSSVRVRNSEGKFEYMEFTDVRDPLLDYIEKYIDIYNNTRNKYNVKFRDPKERRILQNFFQIMNDDLDIYLREDLKEDLNIRDSSSEKSEDVRYKQFDRVSLDNIHVQTKKYYTCKKGEFVLKDNK
jgi:hypothetical protein